MVRQSPSDSATLYRVHAQAKGNDGNMWAVTKDVNGRKYWARSMIHDGHGGYTAKRSAKKRSAKKSAKKRSAKKVARKGPSDSATLYRVNARKRGNDGNMWSVKTDINGRKRWVKY